MAAVVDLTRQNVFTTFSGSSCEDISYATNFWQSIQLHPPMESRLVSSDIKQRLKVAPPSSIARKIAQVQDSSPALRDFMSRVKTMEHLEEYARMQRVAEAKAQDKTTFTKQREIRKQKEEISKNKGIKPLQRQPETKPKREEYQLDEEDDKEVLKQIEDFEQIHCGAQDSDSD